VNGDSSLGLSTTVQPAASAGATLAVTWYSGQFHGVISAQDPDRFLADEDPLTSLSNANSRSTSIATRTCSIPK
jgi:hypothetical protein